MKLVLVSIQIYSNPSKPTQTSLHVSYKTVETNDQPSNFFQKKGQAMFLSKVS